VKGLTNYIIIILLLVLIGLTLRNNKKELDLNTALAEQRLDTIPVRTAKVEQRRVERSLELAGMITAEQNLLLMAQAQGRVTRTLVSEGEPLDIGDIIVVLDDSYLQSEQKKLSTSLNKLSKDLRRFKILAESKAITNQQLEGAQLQYDNAKTQNDILLQRISDTRVKSPISGVLSKLLVEDGSMVGPGIPVAQILSQSNFSIRFAVNDRDIIKIRAGQLLTLTEIGFQGVSGLITQVGISKNRMGKYDVEATLSDYDNAPIKTDMIRNARIIISDSTEQLVVPLGALLYREDQRGVYKTKGSSVEFIPLEVLESLSDKAIVKGDLVPNDRVVIEGQYRINEATEVKVVQ